MSSQGGNQPTGEAPILQIDSATFRAAVTAVVTAVMAQFNANNSSESGSGASYSNHNNNQENLRLSADKDTPYHKPKNNKWKSWVKKGEKSAQGPTKRWQPVTTHAVATTSVNWYAGNLLECEKSNYYHTGACREIQCINCRGKGYTTHFCRVPTRSISQVNQVCFRCGESRHFKRDCPIERKDEEACFCGAPTQHITLTTDAGIVQVWYACGEIGHYKRDCPTERNDGGEGGI